MPKGLRDGEIITANSAGFAEYGFLKNFNIDMSLNNHKKVLITGEGSYIGESFKVYAKEHYPKNFTIDIVSTLNDDWKTKDFGNYDCVYHVAGIAHADVGNVDQATIDKYYSVNTDLAIEVAKLCKNADVKQYIFMSSAIIYGDSAPYGIERRINSDTLPAPTNFYGDSKWQADKGVRLLDDGKFKVAVLRPPMIYGKGSKGNYKTLSKMAKRFPFFPKADNSRSMLHIDNLCEFLCKLILSGENGIYFPQNAEYIRTSDMVRDIRRVSGKRTITLRCLNFAVFLASKIPGKVGILCNKAFGNLTYESKISSYSGMDYIVCNYEDSILKTEK